MSQVGLCAHLAAPGRDSLQDVRGACTLLSTQLSSLLGERPITHSNESDLFLDCFLCCLTYQVWRSQGCSGCSQYPAFPPGSQHPRGVPGINAGLCAPSVLCFVLAEHDGPPGVLNIPVGCSRLCWFLSIPLGAGHCTEHSAPLLDVGHSHQTLSIPTGCWAPCHRLSVTTGYSASPPATQCLCWVVVTPIWC